MRRIFYASVLVWLCVYGSVGRAAHVYFNLQNFTTQNVSNKTFKIVPLSMPSSSGGAIILREPQTVTTGNGTFYVSNMVAGSYSCTVSTPIVPTTFSISVPDTNTVVYATNLLITTSATTTPDDQFVKKLGSWSYNQILTGAVLRGSSTAFQHTNGAVNGYVLTTDGTNATWAAAPGASGGEANVLGHLGTTNTTDTFSLEGTKSGVSLLMPPLRAGANISLTNQGTNIVIASTGGSLTGYVFNANQFAADNVTNVSIKAGVQATNVDANNLTNRGVSLLSGQVTANSSVSVGNTIVLDPSDGRVQGKYLNLDIGGGAFGTWHTNYLDLFGGSILNAGGITNNGVLTNQGAVSVKGPATFYGAVSNLSLTGSQLTGTDANDKLISYSAGTGIAFGASSVALNEAALPIVSSLFPTNLVRAQDGTGASESITVSNLFNSISPSYLVAAGDSLVAYDTYTANVPVAQRVAYGADWFTKLITRSNYFFQAKSYNLGRAGSKANEWMTTYYDSDVVPLAPPSTNGALLALEVGVNDVVNGRTFAQITNDIGVLWTRGASNNFAVVAFTVATNSNGTMSAAEDQVRTNFNVWVRTNSQLYYKLVDSDLIMTNSVTGTVDGIHWLPLYNENLAQNFVTNVAPLGLQKFWGKLAPPTDLDVKGIKATNAVISALLEVPALIRAGYIQVTNSGSPGTKTGMELLYDALFGTGGYIQAYDRDNSLWKDMTIHGNTTHIYSQIGLSLENIGASAGYVLTTSDSVGAATWQAPSTLNSPLLSYMVKKPDGTLGSVSGNSNDIVFQNYRGMSFPYLNRQLATNGPIMVMEMGDSLNGLSGNVGSDFFGQEMMNYFVTNYGYAGALGQGQNASWYWLPRVTAPGYLTNNDFTTWYPSHWVLPNTGILVASNNVGNGTVLGNVYEVDYVASNGFGGFTVETNVNLGTYATLTTLVANLGAGIGPTGMVYRFTNSVSCPTTLRITCISNTVKILGVGIMNYTTNGGVIVNDFAYNSTDLSQFGTVPTNIMGPILRAWKPDLAIYRCIDGSGSFIAANLPKFNTFFDYYLTNTDLLIVGLPPAEHNDVSGIVLQNIVWFTNCIAKRQAYFDGYSIFGDWTNGYRMGYLKLGDDPHFTQAGAVFTADAVAIWMNVFNSAHRGFWNSIPFPYSSRTNDFTVTNGGFVFLGGKTNAFEVRNNSASILGGFDSNGVAFLQVSNSAIKNPASYNLATTSGLGSSTNTTTATNSLFGAIGQGSLTLPARFTATFTNRVVVADLWGDYWTGATPGNCRFIASLGGAAVNVSTVTITPPFSVVAGRWEAQLKYLFLTNSSTVGSFDMSGKVTFYSGGGIITNAFLPWTRIVNDDTTTNQDIGFWSTNGAATDSFLARGGTLSLQ